MSDILDQKNFDSKSDEKYLIFNKKIVNLQVIKRNQIKRGT